VRRPLLLAISLALCQAAVAADDRISGPANPSIVELTVNEQADPVTLIVRRDLDGTLLVRLADLPALRLNTPARGIVSIDGERYLRIDETIGASVSFDDASQSANIRLPSGAFEPTRMRHASPEAPRVTPASLGGFLNYDAFSEQIDGTTNLGGFLELGMFGPRGVVTHSQIAQRRDGEDTATRLDSTWTLDFPDRLATLRVGDAISAPGAWGRSVRFGGVQFGTNFATQPTLVTTPLLHARGEAIVPSTVDVFVNGRRVASEDVPPGPFSIERLPPITGAGELQVVVTDALGRQQVVTQPYYTGRALLRPGLNEYSFEAGVVREDYGLRSDAYGDPVLAGTFRRGLSDQLTAEVHAESRSGGATAVGVDTAWQIGDLGIVTLTAAAGGDGGIGWLGGVGFERSGPRTSVFVRTQYRSEQFAQLGSASLRQQPRRFSFGGVGLNLGQVGNLQLSYGEQTDWSGPGTRTLGLSHTVTLGDMGYLGLTASRTMSDGATTDLFLNWSMPLGERRTVGTSLQHSPGRADLEPFEAVASLQKSLPSGAGTGYYVSLSASDDAQLDYAVQGDSGLIGVQYARRDGRDGWRASANGALAVTGAGVMASRRLDRSFAVVRVADYPGITIYVENQPIGRTDDRGRLLLASLRPFEVNTVSVDPRELPLDASLATTTMSVTPAFRSGPVVPFPVIRASAATLRLVTEDGAPVPAGATVSTDSERVPVAMDGLVYLAQAAGRRDGRADWTGGSCRFSFERPEHGDPQPDLGTLICRGDDRATVRPSDP
jgi:outer membrane usher protein